VRARLVVIFTIPGVLLFVVLGAAYAFTMARSGQQELYLDRLSDTSYLVGSARQSLTADDPGIVAGELERYGEVYGIGAAVLNQSGEVWASNGLDVMPLEERFTALAGRRSELSEQFLPWMYGDLVVAEPVFEGGDLVGAVVTSSSTDRLAVSVSRHWSLLALGGLAALVLAIMIANRLASWVLRPVRAVGGAMAEMRSGDMSARIPESSGPPELRQVVAQFNSMAEKVEQLMHKQQEFVANASHELRNPLHALLLRIEDLSMTITDERSEQIDHVRIEGRRLARILDAVLMLARDQDFAPGADPVELSTLVARRVDGWRPIAGEKGIEITLTAPGEAWAYVDEIVLESAFDAVADNAVKFAPTDSAIDVTVAVGDGRAEIVIRDRGPGVRADELVKITERFWRSPEQGDVPGSGLGLAIASELLDNCGGDLYVAPANGAGLAVTLRVPIAADGGGAR
jgi:signal transduction histidine kinase